MLKIEKWIFNYGDSNQFCRRPAFSFNLVESEIGLLVGVSGIGKTTLLRCIVGLYNNYEGRIMLGEADVRTLSRQKRIDLLGYVPQEYTLINNLTVLDNISQPLILSKKYTYTQATSEAVTWLERFGLSDYTKRYPMQLSGGQRQRVRLAMAFGMKPKILILDEPTSALDKVNTQQVVKIIIEEIKKKAIILISTQDSYLGQLLNVACSPKILEMEYHAT